MKQPKLTDGHHWFTNEHGEPVCTGARMGRPDEIPEQDQPWPRLYLQRMEMSSCGAYDNGGAYWGSGDRKIGYMYIAFNADHTVLLFERAIDRRSAWLQLLNRYHSERLTFHFTHK